MKDCEKKKIMAVLDGLIDHANKLSVTAYRTGWVSGLSNFKKYMNTIKVDDDTWAKEDMPMELHEEREKDRHSKYIGMRVYAGGTIKGYYGTIEDVVRDDDDPRQVWYVVRDPDGFLDRWDITELKRVRTVTVKQLVDLV